MCVWSNRVGYVGVERTASTEEHCLHLSTALLSSYAQCSTISSGMSSLHKTTSICQYWMNGHRDLEKWKVLRLRERFSTTFTGQRNSFSHLVSRFGRFACDFRTWGMEFVVLGAIVHQVINETPKNLQSTVFRWSYWRCLAPAAADRRR